MPRSRRSWLIVVLVALPTVGLVSACAMLVGKPKNPTTVAEVEAKIAPGLAPGTPRAEVEAWLKEKGLEYHYQPAPVFLDLWAREEGLKAEDMGGKIGGTIVDTHREFMVTYCIQFFVFFDKNEKVINHKVVQNGTGP